MFLRPGAGDARAIGFTVGRAVFALGLVQLVPALIAIGLRDWNTATSFVLSAAIAVTFGRAAQTILHAHHPLNRSQGLVTVALIWFVGALFGAVPLYLSGHWRSYFDAFFEAMSGLTTTGLTLAQDLDHLDLATSLWRHALQIVGGQGFVIVALTVFAASAAEFGRLNVRETRDDRLVPGALRVSRTVLAITGPMFVFGVVVLLVAGLGAGLTPWRSLYHALTLTSSAVDTGGFGPTSASVAYYHSRAVEGTLVVLMLGGALSYAIHHEARRANLRELGRHFETRTATVTLVLLVALAFVGLGRSGTFTDLGPMFRNGFFAVVSAVTTTGLSVVRGPLIVTDWGLIAPAALVGAMGLGGMALSTAGGIKAGRVGLAVKGLLLDVRRVLLPESTLVVQTFHAGRRHVLRDEHVRAAVTLLLLYLLTYVAGGMVGLFYGFDFTQALFDSTAATSNTGMSVGIVDVTNPIPLKVTLIAQMWLGRLEFLAVFALLGYVYASIRGRS